MTINTLDEPSACAITLQIAVRSDRTVLDGTNIDDTLIVAVASAITTELLSELPSTNRIISAAVVIDDDPFINMLAPADTSISASIVEPPDAWAAVLLVDVILDVSELDASIWALAPEVPIRSAATELEFVICPATDATTVALLVIELVPFALDSTDTIPVRLASVVLEPLISLFVL